VSDRTFFVVCVEEEIGNSLNSLSFGLYVLINGPSRLPAAYSVAQLLGIPRRAIGNRLTSDCPKMKSWPSAKSSYVIAPLLVNQRSTKRCKPRDGTRAERGRSLCGAPSSGGVVVEKLLPSVARMLSHNKNGGLGLIVRLKTISSLA
jgi:hypothetical protein